MPIVKNITVYIQNLLKDIFLRKETWSASKYRSVSDQHRSAASQGLGFEASGRKQLAE